MRTALVGMASLVTIHFLHSVADSAARKPSTKRDQVGLASCELVSGSRPGDLYQVEATLQVDGEVKLPGNGAKKTLPMNVAAKLSYVETILETQATPRGPFRSARVYSEARALIKTGTQQAQPALRDDRREIVVRCDAGRTTMFSPRGPLTRDELDLLEILGNSLIHGTLLPGRRAAVGDDWLHSQEVVSALLGMDAISQSEVRSVLVEVSGETAKIELAGTVYGAAVGVSTELDVEGSYDFDLRHRYIPRMELTVKEKRSIGHIGPGLDVVAKLKLQLAPANPAGTVGQLAAVDAGLDRSSGPLDLIYESQRSGFYLTYDRRWYVTADQPSWLTLRLVDRGELVVQCQISPLANRSPDRETTLDDYQRDVRFALGDHFGELVAASQWEDQLGQRVYRVVARGNVKELPIEWRYYMLTHPEGRRVAVSFTVEGPLAARLDDADRKLVEGLQILAARPET